MNLNLNYSNLARNKGRGLKVIFQLIIFIFFITTSNFAYAQDVKVNVTLENATLKQFFSVIEKQSKYRFSYRDADIANKENITLKAQNQTVSTILQRVLTERSLQYTMVGNKIVISTLVQQKSVTAPIGTRKIKVTGFIKDNKGEDLIGASVLVLGTKGMGTVTDATGQFVLPDVTEGSILQISSVGYKTLEVKAHPTLNIVLQEDTKALDEVVVVGYAVQKKVNLSGSVSTVPIQKLENRPVVNVGQALQGAVAGLNVTVSNGQATSSPSFNVRGYTSLNGGSPLVVIDGVIADASQLNRMNPNDIENISILKDAASSAIYGSRAAFGVILVTTKKGHGEKVKINYNNNFVWRTITQMPKIITDPYLVCTTRNTMSLPWYNLYNEQMLAIAKGRSEDPENTPLYYVDPSSGAYTYFGETDWVKEAYKNYGFSTIHDIDISGNTDKLNYYFSGGYNFQDGMIKYGTDKYHQYNLRSKLEFILTNWWKFGNNTSFVTSDYDSPRYLNSNYYWNINRCNPLDVPKHADGTWTSAGASVLGRMQDGGKSKTYSSTLSTLFTTRVDFIKDVLFVNGSFNYQWYKSKNNAYSLPVTYYNGEGLTAYTYDPTTEAWGSDTTTKHITWDVYGTFTKTFAEKHFFNVLVGFNQEDYRYDYTYYDRKNLISASLPTVGLATGDQNVNQSISTWSLRGAYGRFNYIFDNKYIFEFDGRYDGTSRFPHNDRFVFNPSASIAWLVSQEKFFTPLKNTFDMFKIRLSYGSLGNQDVSDYAYIPTMSSGKTSSILEGEQPVYVSSPGLVSGNLTWEKVTTANVGVDFSLFNNRLSFTADMYQRKTTKMLTQGQVLPGVLGTSVPQENAADLKTTGWDLTLSWRDTKQLSGKPISYNLEFNLSDSRAKITKFANPTGTLSQYYEGYKIGTIWGMKTLGFYTSDDDVKNSPSQSLVASYLGTRPLGAGDLKFEDRDGSKVIDWGKWTREDHGDYYKIGDSSIHYRFGFTASANWNNFDVSMFVQGVLKRDYYPGTSDLFFWGIYAQPWTNITYGNYYDRWTENTTNGYFPRFKSYVADSSDKECGVQQTRYLQNASYARLKNLTIGYTLPKLWTIKAGIERLRIFFSGDNLFEISGLYKYYKVDPEGLGGQMYPFQRYYSFGVNVTL